MGKKLIPASDSVVVIEIDDDFAISKIRVPPDGQNKTLAQTALGQNHNVTIEGIKRPAEDFRYGRSDTMVHAGDLLIVAATTSDIQAFAGEA